MDNQTKTSACNPVSLPELFWLLGAIVAGSILRLAFPGRMAVEHFDEGVYASNLWFGADSDYAYPARFLYAPPLLPAAIEWSMILASLIGIKPVGLIPMLPSLIAGIAMIPSAWWVCRRWFGPVAGLVTAWLIATSDFHASYSRAALTDVPVCLFILWAVYFIGQSLLATSVLNPSLQKSRSPKVGHLPWSPPLRDIFLAGGFTGLAWWTKYNGWLPLAIGFAGGLLWQVLLPPAERQVRRVAVTWLLIATIAVLIWSPVLWGLQKQGGYATVAANHRQYIVGLDGWSRSAFAQIDVVRIYENPLSLFFSSSQLTGGQLSSQTIKSQIGSVQRMTDDGRWLLAFFTLLGTVVPVLSLLLIPLGTWALSMVVCISQLLDFRGVGRRLPVCLVFAWLMGMSIATPFYHPYPRLILPWLCSVWICLGMAFEIWAGRFSTGQRGGFRPLSSKPVAMLATFLVLVAAIREFTGSGFAWEDRTSMQATSKIFAATLRRETGRAGFPEDEAIVYVIGEPALVFGLKSEGLLAVGPVQDLGFMKHSPRRPTFVAFSSRMSSMPPDVREDLGSPHFKQEEIVRPRASHLVQLDEGISNSSLEFRGTTELKLFRLNK